MTGDTGDTTQVTQVTGDTGDTTQVTQVTQVTLMTQLTQVTPCFITQQPIKLSTSNLLRLEGLDFLVMQNNFTAF